MPVLPSLALTTARPVLRHLVALLLLVVMSVGVLAAAPAAADVRPARLTAAQERELLRLIDNVCGDTWCEGDHAFRFHRFSCHPKRAACLLVVQIASWSEEPLRWRWRAQPVRGFSRYADMVTTSTDGWSSLRPAFYAAVSEAVSATEASVDVAATSRC